MIYSFNEKLVVENMNEGPKELVEIIKEKLNCIIRHFKDGSDKDFTCQIEVESNILKFSFDSQDGVDNSVRLISELIESLEETNWIILDTTHYSNDEYDAWVKKLKDLDESVFDCLSYYCYISYGTDETGDVSVCRRKDGKVQKNLLQNYVAVNEIPNGRWYGEHLIYHDEYSRMNENVLKMIKKLQDYVEIESDEEEFDFYADKLVDNCPMKEMFDLLLEIYIEVYKGEDIEDFSHKYVKFGKKDMDVLVVDFHLKEKKYDILLAE